MVFKMDINVSNRSLVILSILGAILMIAGVYLGFKFVPGILIDKIWENKVLKENTTQWETFVKAPFPFTFKVYVHDIINPDDILQGSKPKVRQVGPFVYKVYKWKNEIEWSSPDEISYNSYLKFEFDKEASGIYSDDTEVTILNTPLLGILRAVEATQPDMLPLLEGALPEAFGEINGMFIKVKVRDYLWNGIRFCENEGKNGGFAAAMMCKQIMSRVNTSKNLRIKDNSVLFANMYYKNNTHLGRYTINSGRKVREETGTLLLYNGKSYISVWPGEKSLCNKIRGVAGMFPAQLQPDMVFESFSEDICRTFALTYDSEETIKSIKGYKFVVRNDTFNASLPANSCYCNNQSMTFNNSKGCVKDGITDLTPCSGGAVMVSFPHLLYGDKEYLESVEGLEPDKNRHESFVILEPMTGLPLYGAQRIQFNMFIRPITGIEKWENISSALLPLVWIEETFVIPDRYVKMLQENLFKNMNIINIVTWVVMVLGGVFVLLGVLTLIYRQSP